MLRANVSPQFNTTNNDGEAMSKESRQLQILAMTLMMSFVLSVSQTASAQDETDLTADEALAFLQEDTGKWTGTRTSLDGAKEDSTVTIVNRIEAGKWLYFQIAEKVDDETVLSKGTLQFDSESGAFNRRWFEDGNAEIKQANVEFDAATEEYRYSMLVPAPLRLAPASGPDEDLPENVRVTITANYRFADTRVIETFVQEDLEDESKGDLKSKLVLRRVKPTASPRTAKNPNTRPPKKAAPVTHVLKVTVLVGSKRLEASQKPILTILPDGGVKVQRLSADTYEFTGLKPGEEYTVTGDYKLTTGLGVQTSGETTPWTTPAKGQRKMISSKVLKLEQ